MIRFVSLMVFFRCFCFHWRHFFFLCQVCVIKLKRVSLSPDVTNTDLFYYSNVNRYNATRSLTFKHLFFLLWNSEVYRPIHIKTEDAINNIIRNRQLNQSKPLQFVLTMWVFVLLLFFFFLGGGCLFFGWGGLIVDLLISRSVSVLYVTWISLTH